MFSVYYSRDDVTHTSHKIYRHQYTCSIYYSADYDHEWDERTFAIFAVASVQPLKCLGEG